MRDIEQDGRGHDDVACQAAVDLQSRGAVVAAQVRAPCSARLAATARDAGAAHDRRADRRTVRVRSERLDDAGELVPERDRHHGEHRAAIVLGGVAAAHAAHRDAHECLTWSGQRHRPVDDPEVARGVEHRGSHVRHNSAPVGTSSCTAARSAIMRPSSWS